MQRGDWALISDLIRRKYMVCEIRGEIVDISENKYVGKKGEVVEQILTILQRENGVRKELVELSVPLDSEYAVGDEFSGKIYSMIFGAGFSKNRLL